ncbi:MAG: hypothetical protein R3F49_18785 [Planctomycetota bacterium]
MQRQEIPIQSLQIIIAAFGLGVVAFLAVALGIGPVSPPAEGQEGITLYILIVGGAVVTSAVPAVLFMRRRSEASLAPRRAEALEEVRAGRVPPELASSTIMGAAVGEGIGLLGVVAYLLEGRGLALFLVGLGLAAVASHFPTLERLKERVERLGRASY